MKRQGDNISDQPPVKKPDLSSSTDLRSKIGAKLQTLLNGISTDTRRNTRNRRQLYKDLFGEPQYSEIIIDPTIVVKIEEPDTDECTNDSTAFLNSQNFLKSAKNRLTELLNKQQEGSNKFKNNEKENTLSKNKGNSSSPVKSNSLQNQASHKSSLRSSSRKRKVSSGKEHSSSTSDAASSQGCSKSSALEDIRYLQDGTEVDDILLIETPGSSNNLRNLQPCSANEPNSSSNTDDCIIYEEVTPPLSTGKSDSIVAGTSTVSCQPNTSSQTSVSECYVKKDNSKSRRKSPKKVQSEMLNYDCSPHVAGLVDVILNTEDNINRIPYSNSNDSETVDDPSVPQIVVDVPDEDSVSTRHTSAVNPEPEVVLLCVKKPTHEVITLEDNDESDDVVEAVHECDQCGKAFRAQSLLNFHLRMHGSDSSILASPSSSLIS